jgi:hypothetical protein
VSRAPQQHAASKGWQERPKHAQQIVPKAVGIERRCDYDQRKQLSSRSRNPVEGARQLFGCAQNMSEEMEKSRSANGQPGRRS